MRSIRRPHKVYAANSKPFRTNDELWVAILTGGGGRAFSTGNDLRAMSNAQASGKNTVSAAFSPTPFGGITRDFVCWKPIIAAIRGYCLAGGLEVALACDFRIASDDSKFGMPEVSRGLVAGGSGTQRLARIVGLPAALEILLTGKRVDAAWALAKNLVNEVVPGDQVLTRARQLAEQISENGPIAVEADKAGNHVGIGPDAPRGNCIGTKSFRRGAWHI